MLLFRFLPELESELELLPKELELVELDPLQELTPLLESAPLLELVSNDSIFP